MQSNFASGSRQKQTSKSTIGINAHLLAGEAGYRRAGIHQYIAQVLRHLPREEDGPAYTVYTKYEADFLRQDGITAVSTRLPTENRLFRIVWEQLIWPWQNWRHQVDVLHSMAFVLPFASTKPAIVTVYDLSFLHFPANFPAAQRLYLTSQTRRSVKKAKRIITISQSGKQDVHQFFGVPLHQIDVVCPGVDAMYRRLPEDAVNVFKKKMEINGRFILHVGTLQPRKNIPVLLDAFAKLDDPELQLVLVGGKGWLFDSIFARVKALNLEARVHFTGYAPDEDLPWWYNAADLFVLPSQYEGFGMPIVEAMACGTPVIAANNSSLPEAAGQAGQLFTPNDVDDLAERMANVLYNPQISDKMRQLGIDHAHSFSWEQAGRETAVIYQKVLQGNF
jgi:glycosyltransferase involved in cell wall biosynthesis